MSAAERIVTGRIATLAGDAGFGWVEAIAIGGGRVLGAGRRSDIEGLTGPRTRHLELAPSAVAIPGLTDAHLHLANAAISASQVDLGSEPALETGLRRIAAAADRAADLEGWLLGHGWESDRWGGWPTADDLERAAPGRRVALWAHDHHSLWVSHAALQAAGVGAGTPDPAGGEIRRDRDGRPTGILHESASRLVADLLPPPSADELAAAIPALGRELNALGVVAVHDPGSLVPDPTLDRAFAAYARLSDTGRLPVRTHVCLRQEAIPVAIERVYRSGMPVGRDPDGRARVGWQKLFADGSLGSRTAALLEPFTFEADRPLEPGRERGIWITEPDRLAKLTERAASGGIVTQIHAIGDAGLRAALDALEPWAGPGPLRPRVEHVQLVHPSDLERFARLGVAASVQPVHLRSDAAQARHLWGERAERYGYPWRSLAASGALLPFGTDAPVESFDPWPGLAMAVLRADPGWEAGVEPFGPDEALDLPRALRAACIDGPLSAGETDRGRLIAGQRADLVVIPGEALAEPPMIDGPLATVRPRLVIVDGAVAFEA